MFPSHDHGRHQRHDYSVAAENAYGKIKMNWVDKLFLFVVALLTGVVFFGLLSVLMTATANAEPIVTESTSTVTTNGSQTTKVESPPPSAIAPQFSAGNDSDLCTIGAGGAVQTQILGFPVTIG